MNQREINSKLAEGFIHIRTIIEVMGTPKDHVQKTLGDYVKKIRDDKDLLMVSEDIEKVTETDEMFTAFAELEILVKSTKDLLSFCFDYMPSSVEVLAPEKVMYDTNDLSDFINDMQARLHAVNIGAHNLSEYNQTLIKNTAVLVKNFIFYSLAEAKDLPSLTKIIGIEQEKLKNILESMIKEGRIKKQGQTYTR